MKFFGVKVYVLCSVESKGIIFLHVIKYRLIIGKDESPVLSKVSRELQLEELGIVKSKLGQVSFFPGGIQKAFVVNNNLEDPSLVEINLANIPWDFEMTVDKNYKLKKRLKSSSLPNPGNKFDLQICHTLNTIFVWSKTQHIIFGKSPDYVSRSEIQVPTLSRDILHMACGYRREIF